MPSLSKDQFLALAAAEAARTPGRTLAIPVCISLLDDQLTPVLAYRRLVAPDQREAPSFLLESVEGGERQGRHSILSAQPVLEVVAFGTDVRTIDRRPPPFFPRSANFHGVDPLDVPRRITADIRLVAPPDSKLPRCFLGGWAGYAAYDTVRYAEPEKLDPKRAPPDDRHLPDLHFALYDSVVVFDHVDKLVHVIRLALVGPGPSNSEIEHIYDETLAFLSARTAQLQAHSKPLPSGRLDRAAPSGPTTSNTTREQHAAMVARALEYIRAGDIFQVVLGQRFERRSAADPFDVYRALRAVNPSPYMVYLQAMGCILVASSPEILCRVRGQATGGTSGPPVRVITNRPLAGTRRRGGTPDEDAALERELLADPKERAEHIMLVDLGRNDVGRVAVPGTIQTPVLMAVERYSHVMHISSTVTGELREGLDCWDALRAALPVGTISGAPKIRAMQIIDELEPVRRGPYGGGFGYVGLDGDMDIALALRTMVVTRSNGETGVSPVGSVLPSQATPDTWNYHLQAAGGIVADSDPEAEYQETVNKAAALARAIDLAESAFVG